jgi:VWFA-related protein
MGAAERRGCLKAARCPRRGCSGWILALALWALGGWSLAAGSDPAVRFLEPRHLATVLGEKTIRLAVDVPDGAVVDRVEIMVDGAPLAVLTEPPWEADWSAGGEGRGHRLEAVVHLTDGRQSRSVIRTSPLRVNQIENVDLVNLYLVVRDRSGRYVTDLTRDDFQITEDGAPQTVERFATTHKPLRVGIVLDSSDSMRKQERLEKSKVAALRFLDVLEPGDEAAVVDFNDYVRVSHDFSADKAALTRAIQSAIPTGGTALYDAVWRASRLLADFDGRRVMVLLSDGQDMDIGGLDPGSLHTLDEALEQALRNEVMIFSIGLGDKLDSNYIFRWDDRGRPHQDPSTTLASLLRQFAESTGGRAVFSKGTGGLRKAFSEIAEDLRHQYSIGYVSTNPSRDGKWRSISVATPGRTLEVVTRKGYYAPDSRRADRAKGK